MPEGSGLGGLVSLYPTNHCPLTVVTAEGFLPHHEALSQSAQVAVTKYHSLGGSNNQNLSSHSGGGKSEIEMWADSSF